MKKSYALISTPASSTEFKPEDVKITFAHGTADELPAGIASLEATGQKVVGFLDKETIESLAIGINQFEEENGLK